MTTPLAQATWPEVPDDAVVLVPVGSTEQHGPHLPMDTDTVIADAVARRACELVGNPAMLVAPPLAYGSSGEHQAFPGTASIGTAALRVLLVELTRSLRTWARRVVFVNAHGGNLEALTEAVGQLRQEGHDVEWVPCAGEGVDLHAGRTETSIMLYLRPDQVRLDRAEAGNTDSLQAILPLMRTAGVRAVSANGVLGDPADATATEGELLMQEMARTISIQVLTGMEATR